MDIVKPLRGFTIIEVLIVVAILAVLLGIGLPLTIRFYQTYQISTLSENTLNMIRSAQEKARSGLGAHGIHAEPGGITLYRGTSYALRDTAFDEREEIPSSITFLGTLDFQFMPPLGRPVSAGMITLQNVHRTDTISVNVQGLVQKE